MPTIKDKDSVELRCPFCGSPKVQRDGPYEARRYQCSLCSYSEIIDDKNREIWQGSGPWPLAVICQDCTKDGIYSELKASVMTLGLLWHYTEYMQFYEGENVFISQTWQAIRRDGLNPYLTYFDEDRQSALRTAIEKLAPSSSS